MGRGEGRGTFNSFSDVLMGGGGREWRLELHLSGTVPTCLT